MGSLGTMGVLGDVLGVPLSGGLHRWSGLGVVGELVSGARTVLDEWVVLGKLRVKRPLVEAERREESAGTTRSISQPTPHLVSYTTINNVKIAILSNSPDQQQYQDPKAA